jgi:hypothetical protein
MIITTKDRQALIAWEKEKTDLLSATQPDPETHADKQKRIKFLKENPEEFFKYYFEKYCTAEPAEFHKKATKRIIENNQWFEVRAWSRDMAKSARAMMETIYMAITKKIHSVILISHSYDQAAGLLKPYMLNLEANARIINDYGEQKSIYKWSDGDFTTKSRIAFIACGAGQSPRGRRFEEIRPDFIMFDDIDTDEEVRSKEQIQKKWDWINKAVMGTVSVNRGKRFLFLGNIIGQDTCITRAMEKADYSETINIRNEKGVSNWPQKNSEFHIDWLLSKISYSAIQSEYFNNPVIIYENAIFKELNFKKTLKPNKYDCLVCYTDPSYKEGKKNDFKATLLIGRYRDEFHILKACCEQTSTSNMVNWHYDIMEFVGDAACYYYMEANFLQDIMLKEFYDRGVAMGKLVPIRGDVRKKPDKFARIESLLEPLHRNGKLWFNIDEKANPNMIRVREQFEAFAPNSKAHDDAPDACEGGIFILNQKISSLNPPTMINRKLMKNKNRY